ncbi:MAG TPA: 2-dehydropantoate 2-reductase [Solirubrobacteraceae bacterium]|jgi:2-dehydropantoate 2-reductase|nr:2-dehydropantoate 2-reductase [Solirubrobacteraceae bacterium]
MAYRICIVGAGAIGGLFAAHLATLGDTEVWALDLSAEHVDAINAGGLRLTGHVELVAPVNARSDPGQIPPCELGIVATKGTATAPAIAAAAPIFAAGGAVCSMQNGIGNEEVIAADVPRVIRGVTLPAARVDGPGVIHMVGPGLTWIGPFEPAPAPSSDIELLAELLNRSGLETRALADARGAQWTKLLFNAATNPVCALTGLTHGQMVDHPPSRRLAGELLREGQAVADTLGIVLDSDPVALVDEAGQANYLHRPSMLQDIAARRPTEIATLNGGIVDAARGAGVAVPHHRAIVDLIRGLEHSWTV